MRHPPSTRSGLRLAAQAMLDIPDPSCVKTGRGLSAVPISLPVSRLPCHTALRGHPTFTLRQPRDGQRGGSPRDPAAPRRGPLASVAKSLRMSCNCWRRCFEAHECWIAAAGDVVCPALRAPPCWLSRVTGNRTIGDPVKSRGRKQAGSR